MIKSNKDLLVKLLSFPFLKFPLETQMSDPLYNECKELAYPLLSTIASCGHQKAKLQGYTDGWQMLMDKHDGNEMAFFCMNIQQVLSKEQCEILLNGLAKEFTKLENWEDYIHACSEYPQWRPGRESLEQHIASKSSKPKNKKI